MQLLKKISNINKERLMNPEKLNSRPLLTTKRLYC